MTDKAASADPAPESRSITEQEFHGILRDGIRLWNEQRFFECHDKLEEAWKAVKQEKKREPQSDLRRDFTQGLILFAVAFHHWKNGNRVGALRKYEEATRLLANYPPWFEGVDLASLYARVRTLFESYRSDATMRFRPDLVPRVSLD